MLRMIIFNIPRDMTEKVILVCIMKQNQDKLKEEDAAVMKLCFRTWRKHNEETNWIIEIYPQHEEILLRACDVAIPKKKWHNRSVPWWTKKVTLENRDTYRVRRKYHGTKGPATREQEKLLYRQTR